LLVAICDCLLVGTAQGVHRRGRQWEAVVTVVGRPA